LGVTDSKALKVWRGLFVASSGITLALAMPVWGYLADRLRRKIMILRANLGGALLLFGMSLVRIPQMLIACRGLPE